MGKSSLEWVYNRVEDGRSSATRIRTRIRTAIRTARTDSLQKAT